MAFYPLKVKDQAGAVHTVGDPRIANGGTQAPVASITGGWSSLTVAGKTLTLNSSAATGSTETVSSFTRLTGFIGLTAKFTLPGCSFTARVLGVKTISSNVRTMVLDDIQILTGSYPADGDVNISGTWIEDAGNFAIVRDSRVDVRDHVNVTLGKDVIFDAERELLFQITGPAQTTETPVAPLTAWSNVYTVKNVYPAMNLVWPPTAIVATWTGATGAARIYRGYPPDGATPISYTTSDGASVSFNLGYRSVYRVTSGTYDPTDYNSQYSISVSLLGGAGEDLINGAQYFFFIDSSWSGSVANAVNLDTNAWADGQQNVHSPVTNFSWSLPPAIQHKWPTTVQNPRSTVLNHPLYRAGQYGDVMSVRLAGEPADQLRSVPLWGHWLAAEDGNFLVSNASNGNLILASYGTGDYVYPIDVYSYAEQSSSIKFRGRDSELAGISYEPASGSFTAKGKDVVTSGAAVKTLHVMGEGTPFGQIDNSTLTTTLLTDNYQDTRTGYVQSLWLHTFKLTTDSEAAFWASPILATSQSHWNYYPIFYTASPRSDLCDFWRIRDRRPYETVNVNGTNYEWVSFNAATKTISVVSPRNLNPSEGIPGATFARASTWTVFRMISRNSTSDMYYFYDYGTQSFSALNGLSNGLLNQTLLTAPPQPGYNLTSVEGLGAELKWRPSPGIVTVNSRNAPLNPLSGSARDAFGENRVYSAKVRALYRFGMNFKTNLNLYLSLRKAAEAWDWTEGARVPMHYVTTKRAVGSTTTTTHASGAGTASDTVVNLAQLAGSSSTSPQVFVELVLRSLGDNDYTLYFEVDVFVQDTFGSAVQVYRTTGNTVSGLWGPKIELFAGTTATTGIETIEGRTRIVNETVDW